MTGFSLTKKAVGAYFNDGEVISSCQVMKEHQGNPSPLLIESVKAAQTVFFTLQRQGGRDPKIVTRLRRVIADINRDIDKRYPKKEK